MLLVLAGAAVALVRHSAHQHNLRERTATTVTSLSTSHGVLVPHAIEDLREVPSGMALAELRRQFDTGDEARRFPLAYGLARFGEVKVDLFVSKVETSSPDEVDNLVQALGNSKEEAVSALEAAAETAEANGKWRLKARLAMLALQLDAPSLATDMCQRRPNPSDEVAFSRVVQVDCGPLATCSGHIHLEHLCCWAKVLGWRPTPKFLSAHKVQTTHLCSYRWSSN